MGRGPLRTRRPRSPRPLSAFVRRAARPLPVRVCARCVTKRERLVVRCARAAGGGGGGSGPPVGASATTTTTTTIYLTDAAAVCQYVGGASAASDSPYFLAFATFVASLFD